MRLLADNVVSVTGGTAVSRETVRRTLNQTWLTPWRQAAWCIPRSSAVRWSRTGRTGATAP